MITVIILAKNEENNLEDCIKSVDWADEIIVIDDNSTDKTKEIAQKLKAEVFTHGLNDDFAAQHNFGLKKAKNEWVLFIDADERVSEDLKEEILKAIKKENNYNGFYLKRDDFFLGRWLKHGETAGFRSLRLGRKDKGLWQRKVHEIWQIEEQIGQLENPLKHYSHRTLSDFVKTVNFYSTLHAQALKKEGVKFSLWRLIAYPKAKFIQNYFLKGGFKDGTQGMIMALMMSFHSFLSRAKLHNNQ